MLIGGVVAWTNSYPVAIIAWITGSVLLAFVSGHLPFDGHNLAAWLTDRRLWGVPVYMFGPSPAGRTTLLAILLGFFGIAIGIIQMLAVNMAWERTTKKKELGWESWTLLAAAGLVIAIVPALLTNAFINLPLRSHQILVSETVQLALSPEAQESREADSNYRSVRPFVDSFSNGYEIQLVSFGLEKSTWESIDVDVVFDNGFIMRCSTFSATVVFCSDLSNSLVEWGDELVRGGLYGDQPWLEGRVRFFTVDESALNWLLSNSKRMSENYEVIQSGQVGGWMFLTFQFEGSFEMTCRFTDTAPIRVDLCFETGALSQ